MLGIWRSTAISWLVPMIIFNWLEFDVVLEKASKIKNDTNIFLHLFIKQTIGTQFFNFSWREILTIEHRNFE